MKMYSRDDLMNMKNFGDEDGDEDDEDDDGFPSKVVCYTFVSIASRFCICSLLICHIRNVHIYMVWLETCVSTLAELFSYNKRLRSNLPFGETVLKCAFQWCTTSMQL